MTQRPRATEPEIPGERFAHDAFDSQVGRTVPFRIEGADATEATVVGAKVSDDGTSVTLTLEVPDDVLPTGPARPEWLYGA
jgi:hypothetical protein